MKKLLVTALILSGLAYQAQAQLKLGVKAGANLATINMVQKGSLPVEIEYIGYENKIDLHAGILAQLPIIGKIALQAEALYNRKGAKVYNQDSDNKGPALGYFSVPVMAVFKPVPKIGIQGGVEFGTLLSAKQTIAGRELDKKDEYASNDLGLVGGAQFQITESLNLDARYVYGLKPVKDVVFKDATGNEQASVKWKNQTFQVSLAYLFLK